MSILTRLLREQINLRVSTLGWSAWPTLAAASQIYYGQRMDIDYSSILGFGIVALVIWLVVTVAIILLAIWIQYSIIWHAVRRGMREFHQGGAVAPQVLPPAQ